MSSTPLISFDVLEERPHSLLLGYNGKESWFSKKALFSASSIVACIHARINESSNEPPRRHIAKKPNHECELFIDYNGDKNYYAICDRFGNDVLCGYDFKDPSSVKGGLVNVAKLALAAARSLSPPTAGFVGRVTLHTSSQEILPIKGSHPIDIDVYRKSIYTLGCAPHINFCEEENNPAAAQSQTAQGYTKWDGMGNRIVGLWKELERVNEESRGE